MYIIYCIYIYIHFISICFGSKHLKSLKSTLRFYLFSCREPPETTADLGRDIFNEKPSKEDAAVAASIRTENPLGKQATIHTTMGDIVVKLFHQECPKTVENFTVHSKNGYYASCLLPIWLCCIHLSCEI